MRRTARYGLEVANVPQPGAAYATFWRPVSRSGPFSQEGLPSEETNDMATRITPALHLASYVRCRPATPLDACVDTEMGHRGVRCRGRL